jgi:serine/threonine protein kinase
MTLSEKIGRYIIDRELGRGAMGHVYLARDPYTTRWVAVKLMAPEFSADTQFVQRFVAEAQMVATLEHAYIVPVYDFGSHNNQPYIVMRNMAAGSLHKYLTADPFPLSDVAPILERMCDALATAHERGIVHRDVKPGNILLDNHGDAYLADFGLAKFAAGSQEGLGDLYLVGTPEYMSPEQVMGDATDHRSDVYSLGVILYELLAGRLPFFDTRPMYLVMKHVNEPVPDVMQYNADLPYTVRDVINTALAKAPSDRYATANEFSDALLKAGRGLVSRRARKRWMSDDFAKKLSKLGE